ncbi:MAG: DUF4336 domain-containing protein [Hormoscilla sp. SP12CHS1]|nr:DUF4336 domain-containing protein [Hormoscilla sp. SP12CHS1]
MLTEFVPDRLWTAQVPLRFYGIEMGTRMTVCRLHSGELWVHSPIAPTKELQQELDALGKVSFIVAPNKLHHLFVLDFLTAYPDAKLFGSPDLPQKRSDIPFHGILGDRSEPGWASEIDQVLVRGNICLDEVVFFHQNSRTLILTDLCESAHADSPLSFRIMGRLTGIYDRPGPPHRYETRVSRQADYERFPGKSYVLGLRSHNSCSRAFNPFTRKRVVRPSLQICFVRSKSGGKR